MHDRCYTEIACGEDIEEGSEVVGEEGAGCEVIVLV
jgi:hypothetical protein